jgi:hypothetical protein
MDHSLPNEIIVEGPSFQLVTYKYKFKYLTIVLQDSYFTFLKGIWNSIKKYSLRNKKSFLILNILNKHKTILLYAIGIL